MNLWTLFNSHLDLIIFTSLFNIKFSKWIVKTEWLLELSIFYLWDETCLFYVAFFIAFNIDSVFYAF